VLLTRWLAWPSCSLYPCLFDLEYLLQNHNDFAAAVMQELTSASS